MKKITALLFLLTFVLSSCIKDDYLDDTVDPVIRITNAPKSIAIDSHFEMEYKYFNNVGREEKVDATWSSSDRTVIEITSAGTASALSAGTAVLSVEFVNTDGIPVSDFAEVIVDENEPTQGGGGTSSVSSQIKTTSSYQLEGDLEFIDTKSGVRIDIADNYKATTSLPGLYIYLSNNRNSISGAFEIGKVEVFSGAHQYNISDIGFNDYKYILYYCKPFNVKVGEAEL